VRKKEFVVVPKDADNCQDYFITLHHDRKMARSKSSVIEISIFFRKVSPDLLFYDSFVCSRGL
jgi:hypothetical protein